MEFQSFSQTRWQGLVHSLPYPGLFHNMKIFKPHVDEHLACLIKDNLDVKESNNSSVNNNNKKKNMWAALLDKGYKGSHKYRRFLIPKKKTACCDLDSDNKKKQQNQKQQSYCQELLC